MHTRNNRSGTILLLFAAAVLIALVGASGLAHAFSAVQTATFTVTTIVDAEDISPGDGRCETAVGNGVCSLRAAIQETNALPGADVIILPAGIYTLTLPGILEDHARYGDLDILGDLTLQGAGADLTVVDGNQLDRVFHLVRPSDDVQVSGVTIRSGSVDFPSEGAGRLPLLAESGGCILNQAHLTLNYAMVSGCRAGNLGGGIHSEGTLVLNHTIVRSNYAKEQGGGVANGTYGFSFATPTPASTPFPIPTDTPAPIETAMPTVSPPPSTALATPTPAPVGTIVPPMATPTATTLPPGSSEANIRDSIIEDNVAGHGGGLYNGGSMLLDHVQVRQNRAVSDGSQYYSAGGGGIFNTTYGLLELSVSAVVSNTTDGRGGGLENQGFSRVDRSTIADNQAVQFGGGVANLAEIRMTDSTVRNNTSDEHGGGIANLPVGGYIGAGIVLERCTVSGNATAGNGGGVYNATTSGFGGYERLRLNNSTVSGNLADGSGGGIYTGSSETSSVFLGNVTIANNTADADADEIGDGGGLFNRLGEVQLGDTILAANEDHSLITSRPDCWTPRRLISLGHNLIGNASTCPLEATTAGNLLGVEPRLRPLQDNGGHTQTQALLPDSPAIDAGTPNGCVGGPGVVLEVDQRGFMRPVDGNGDGEAVCDMGAFEYGSVPPIRRYLPVMVIR